MAKKNATWTSSKELDTPFEPKINLKTENPDKQMFDSPKIFEYNRVLAESIKSPLNRKKIPTMEM